MTLAKVASVGSTVVLVLCAMTVTGLTVRRELRPARPSGGPPAVEQSDWLRYAVDGQRLGPNGAKVALVEFADFECPACRVLEERIAESRRRLGVPFAVVYRHLPLDIHRFAQPAAQASECAAEQGRFQAMHDVLFQQQRAIGVRPWKDIAQDAGVTDVARFERCIAGPPKAPIARDLAVANTLDGSGTPMVLVNGLRFAGTIPQDRLDSLIRKSLARPE